MKHSPYTQPMRQRKGQDFVKRSSTSSHQSEISGHQTLMLQRQIGNRAAQDLWLRKIKRNQNDSTHIQRQDTETEATATAPIVEAVSAPESWGEMETVSISGNNFEVFGTTAEHLEVIRNTLSLIPRRHLQQIPRRIVIGERVGPVGTGRVTQGGNSVRRGPAQMHRIELTTYALDHKIVEVSSERIRVCFTLLHEIGHWVDWELRILPPRHSREWQVLQQWFERLHYRGVTTMSGERAAEAYRLYFAGHLPEEIRSIIASSPAFQDLQQDLTE